MPDPFAGLWLVYIAVHAVTLVTQAVIGYWVYRRQWHRQGARWFLVMVGTGILWVGPFLVFFLPVGRPLQEAAYLLGAVAAMATICAFVVFISKYTGTGYHRNRLVQIPLVLITGGCAVLAATNPFHGLIVASFTQTSQPFPHLAVERGLGFQALVIGVRLVAFYALYVMVRHFLATRRKSRVQLLLFLLGAFAITILDIVSEQTALLPLNVSHATFGMLVFYLFTALSLFRFRLLDVKPVARNTIVENLRDPVLVVDEQRRVVDFNQAARWLWPALGDPDRNQFEAICPTLANGIDEFPDSATATVSEQLPLTMAGEERHYSVTVSGVQGTDGEHTGWYTVLLRDVTELERSRGQLEKQNERLEQVGSTISHDLRNPINIVEGHLELMEGDIESADIDPETAEGLRDRIDEVETATGRMQEIIDDILTIAREGKTVEETDQLDLETIAEAAWSNVDTRAATLRVAASRPILADRSKLLTILENLFRNSVDHGPDDVTVTVGTTEGGFFVADDGPGIPAEHHDNLFEYGYTTSEEGTGLGLSIVETMADAHGWTVQHDPDVDGTRFVFSDVTGEGAAPGEALSVDSLDSQPVQPPATGTDDSQD
jgi:signal transduction histidine kinase